MIGPSGVVLILDRALYDDGYLRSVLSPSLGRAQPSQLFWCHSVSLFESLGGTQGHLNIQHDALFPGKNGMQDLKGDAEFMVYDLHLPALKTVVFGLTEQLMKSQCEESWSDPENLYSNDRSILTLSPIEASHC
ncbi:unnamed protein product [Arctogadus glacialis]